MTVTEQKKVNKQPIQEGVRKEQTDIHKHVVMFSTGAGSAYLAKYVLDRYGRENTILLLTDTKWEDEDNYRFLKEVSEYLDFPIMEQTDGRTPEDIFYKDLYFGNFSTAPCSKELKMKQTYYFVQDLISQGHMPILYFGIGYDEAQRAPRLAFNYRHNIDAFEDGVELRFPLIGEIDGEPVSGEHLFYGTNDFNADKLPRMYKKTVHERLKKQNFKISTINPKRVIPEEWGIKLPRMYELGFSHANCKGRCIKGGFNHYRTLYKQWPDRYMEQEEMERKIIEERVSQGKKPYTILGKEQILPNGYKEKQPYSLERYRKEVLELENQMDIFDFIEVPDTPCECIF